VIEFETALHSKGDATVIPSDDLALLGLSPRKMDVLRKFGIDTITAFAKLQGGDSYKRRDDFG